ncbi:MAG: SpoIIE family protein phosphatase [Candidatus Eremiobacteraeota bacterium]|nr:SpoIIE family protein phosphatase [Candidatus Eremiobacteraeota bacterium]
MTTDAADIQRLRTEAEYMRFLVAAGELLSSSLNYRTTLGNVCKAAVDSIADICVLDLGTIGDVNAYGAAHRDPRQTPELDAMTSLLHSDPGRPAHPVCSVLESGKTFFAPIIDDAWIEAHAANRRHAEFMRAMEYRSMIVVPVRSQIWGLTGALTLVRTRSSGETYDANAIAFAEDLGRRCGIAIGKARLHSQMIDVAERFQRAALPASLPALPNFRLNRFYEAADAALLVGGDWYDAFLLRDGRMGLSIGDVAGHGVEAAALMSSVRDAIRMALVLEPDLSRLLESVDYLFRSEAGERFCTAAIAVIDPESCTIEVASAGHPSPLLWENGEVRELAPHGVPPLGYVKLAPQPVEVDEHRLQPGSMIVFYTDGLIEWERNTAEGLDALHRALHDPAIRAADDPALAIRNTCIKGPHSDDVAILTVRVI